MSYLLKANNGDVQYCFCGDLILPAGLGNTALDGGDAMQMAPGKNSELNKIRNAKGRIQKLKLFMRGSAISGAISRGQRSIERPAKIGAAAR